MLYIKVMLKGEGGMKTYSDILTFVLTLFTELPCRKTEKLLYLC